MASRGGLPGIPKLPKPKKPKQITARVKMTATTPLKGKPITGNPTRAGKTTGRTGKAHARPVVVKG